VAACGLEQRRLTLERERRAAELEQRLRDSEAFLERTGRVAGVGGWEVDVEEGEIIWSDQTCRIHDLPPGYRPSMQEAVGYYPPKARAVIAESVEEGMRSGAPWDLELPLVTSTGRPIWVHTVGALEEVDGRRRLIGAIQDITERRQAVDAMAASESKYRKLFQYSLGLICTHDLEGRLLSVNPAAARSLGHAVEELEGRSLTELMRPERREFFKAYLSQMVLDGTAGGMVELMARDGSFCHWQYRNVLDVETDVPYVLVHAQDVSVQYQQEKQLLEWSFTDPLTSCYNRRFLQDLERQPGPPVRWGCLVVDLDKFKLVNDTHGHQAGDEVLVGMAWFLNGRLRRQDRLVRLGGDEFLVLVHEATLDELHALAQAYEAEADEAPIAFTLGVAAAEAGEPLPETLRRADKALYARRR
ncbi:diguanylate cyclase, partial [Xanthomonas sp. Kuri4-1]